MSYLDEILMCFGSWLLGHALDHPWGYERRGSSENRTHRFGVFLGWTVLATGVLLAIFGPEPAHGATVQYPPLCDRCDRAATRMWPIVREGTCLINEQTGEPERTFTEVRRSPRCAYHVGFEADRLPPIPADVWVSAARCFAAGWIYTPCK